MFNDFSGNVRHCVRFKRSSKAKGLRCAKYKGGRGQPICPKGLKGGGRVGRNSPCRKYKK